MGKPISSFLLLLVLALPLGAAQERFYLGTNTRPGGSKGIYTGVIDEETGRLGPITLAAEANNPGYVALSPNYRHLYAVTSDSGGSVAAYTVKGDGSLGFLDRVSCGGSGPCHVSVDGSGHNVFVANYGDGSIACIQVRGDGSLGDMLSSHKFSGSGPNPGRQKEPHAHGIYADAANRFVYACDLGTDRVWVFHFDAAKGSLEAAEPQAGLVPPGAGPRHLAFSPDETMAYVNGEMGRTVTVFKRDASTGALSPVQTLPIVPASQPDATITTAEIECDPAGKFVYVSSRGDNLLAVFAVQQDGTLKFVQDVPAGVKVPRGFGIDPAGRWLIACGQQDGELAVFRIAPGTGELTAAGSQALGGAPICVAFIPPK